MVMSSQRGTMARKILSVIDWTVDPGDAIAALAQLQGDDEITIVVPAKLHGLDWIGDPQASVPCARRQAHALRHEAAVQGVNLRYVAAGDPDPSAAAIDFCLQWPFDEVAVIGFPARVAKATGLPARRLAVERPAHRRMHCAPPSRARIVA
jgi:hypothetical protein